jgi:hypothetical protein
MEVVKDMSNDHQSGCLYKVFVNCVESFTNLFTIEVSVFGDSGQWNFDKMELNQIIRCNLEFGYDMSICFKMGEKLYGCGRSKDVPDSY